MHNPDIQLLGGDEFEEATLPTKSILVVPAAYALPYKQALIAPAYELEIENRVGFCIPFF